MVDRGRDAFEDGASVAEAERLWTEVHVDRENWESWWIDPASRKVWLRVQVRSELHGGGWPRFVRVEPGSADWPRWLSVRVARDALDLLRDAGVHGAAHPSPELTAVVFHKCAHALACLRDHLITEDESAALVLAHVDTWGRRHGVDCYRAVDTDRLLRDLAALFEAAI